MQTDQVRNQIRAVIMNVSRPNSAGKVGNQLHRDIAAALQQRTDFKIDKEDTGRFLQDRMPVWRDKKSREIEPTSNQRRIDIVVYDADVVAALIEVESDLNDLQLSGVSSRNGHYDVFSIARSASGEYFHSYKSLERMAAATMYYHLDKKADAAVGYLEALNSDSPNDHNPDALPMFLVSGSCRAVDRTILLPRLTSLNAELICK